MKEYKERPSPLIVRNFVLNSTKVFKITIFLLLKVQLIEHAIEPHGYSYSMCVLGVRTRCVYLVCVLGVCTQCAYSVCKSGVSTWYVALLLVTRLLGNIVVQIQRYRVTMPVLVL